MGVWEAFFLGLIAFFVGSSLFAIATYRTGVLSRRTALLLGVAPIPIIAGGIGGGLSEVLILAGLACFTLAWMALGVSAIRLDQPATEPSPG